MGIVVWRPFNILCTQYSIPCGCELSFVEEMEDLGNAQGSRDKWGACPSREVTSLHPEPLSASSCISPLYCSLCESPDGNLRMQKDLEHSRTMVQD